MQPKRTFNEAMKDPKPGLMSLEAECFLLAEVTHTAIALEVRGAIENVLGFLEATKSPVPDGGIMVYARRVLKDLPSGMAQCLEDKLLFFKEVFDGTMKREGGILELVKYQVCVRSKAEMVEVSIDIGIRVTSAYVTASMGL